MFKKALASVALGLCILNTTAFAGPNVRTYYEYGSFVLNNPTSETLHYQIKWGDQAWENFDVGPGEWHAHYVDLGADQKIPVPLVRFDCVTHDDRVTFLEYELDAYGVDDAADGKDYSFGYTDDGRFLDLFED
jgi:hypothetical protein